MYSLRKASRMRRLGRLGPRGAAPSGAPAPGPAVAAADAPLGAPLQHAKAATAPFAAQPKRSDESSHS
jgi:hypothetical protein